MDSDCQFRIPVINFSVGSPEMDRGTEGWHQLCKRVREACENYGCFEVVHDKIPTQARAEMFSVIREFFGLPSETKSKNVNPKPYHGYYGEQSDNLFYEGFGIEDATNYHPVKNFVDIMWPHGQDQFCENVHSAMRQMDELYQTIEKMIIDSYGLGEKMGSIMGYKTLIRGMKYQPPPPGKQVPGLVPHSDKLSSVILCDDQVSGLEVETKDGQWIELSLSPTSFIFLVGDPLMAWSNGRMHAVKHKVIVKGDKARYSFGAFQVPIEGTVIKPPKELLDEKHPQVFKEFDFMDFLHFSNSKEGLAMESDKVVYVFASN